MMKTTTCEIVNELVDRYPVLAETRQDVEQAFDTLQKAVADGKKILVCGNGGSASDSEHIVGELMKCFKKARPIDTMVAQNLQSYGEEGQLLQNVLEGTVRAIALTSHSALSTAFSNDKCPDAVFAQQLYGLGDSGDVLICLSTSGNSKNCVLASVVAKAKGMSVVAFTGHKESKLSALADVAIRVGETETFKVQELHLPVYHCLCAMLEEENF